MRILAVHHAVPTRRVTNDDILEELRTRSRGHLHPHDLAFVEAIAGDKSRAIPRLQHLLEIPYSNCLTPALLRLDPAWDPLRSDPRFEGLCDGIGERLFRILRILLSGGVVVELFEHG